MPAQAVRAWADRVHEQLQTCCDLRRDHFILLAGQNYRKYLTPYLTSYEVPMEGLRIGSQLQFLNRRIAELSQT
ncbi:hypothetical protein LCGC14_2296130 [marine sediment metagenome]|uniref:DUF6884 domain-containing protein n=1 Tax=marine sediment metagenome TaxID=412755 RepID=A0A0F9CQD1_9ZZZZ